MAPLRDRLRNAPSRLPRIAITAGLFAVTLAAGYGLLLVRATHTGSGVMHLCVSSYTG
jgi:hypothetical protein